MIDDRFHDFLLPKNLTCFMSSQLLNPQTFLSHFLFLDGLYLLPCSCLHLLLLTFFPWVLLQKMRLFCLPLVPHCLLGTHCRWRDDWKCTEHKWHYLWPFSWHPDHSGLTGGQGAGPDLLGHLLGGAAGHLGGLRVHPAEHVHPVTGYFPFLQSMATSVGTLKHL